MVLSGAACELGEDAVARQNRVEVVVVPEEFLSWVGSGVLAIPETYWQSMASLLKKRNLLRREGGDWTVGFEK